MGGCFSEPKFPKYNVRPKRQNEHQPVPQPDKDDYSFDMNKKRRNSPEKIRSTKSTMHEPSETRSSFKYRKQLKLHHCFRGSTSIRSELSNSEVNFQESHGSDHWFDAVSRGSFDDDFVSVAGTLSRVDSLNSESIEMMKSPVSNDHSTGHIHHHHRASRVRSNDDSDGEASPESSESSICSNYNSGSLPLEEDKIIHYKKHRMLQRVDSKLETIMSSSSLASQSLSDPEIDHDSIRSTFEDSTVIENFQGSSNSSRPLSTSSKDEQIYNESIHHISHSHSIMSVMLEKCFPCNAEVLDQTNKMTLVSAIEDMIKDSSPQIIGECDPSNPSPNSWSTVDPSTFLVRGPSYLKDKKKVPAPNESLYRALNVHVFKTANKLTHAVKLPYFSIKDKTSYKGLPCFLCINVQLPLYPPSFLNGPMDGEGLSLVICFELNESCLDNYSPHMITTMQKFISGVTEDVMIDGLLSKHGTHVSVRDRLKLIARLANPDGVNLGVAEKSLINAWNQKPVLTRPQHQFLSGDGWLEIDLDVHRYAYVMRRGIQALRHRFHSFIFDVALIVQGNEVKDLPENVLCCLRFYHLDILLP